MQNSRSIQCDDSCNIKMYSDAIFINELNNCKHLYFLFYIILDIIIGIVFGETSMIFHTSSKHSIGYLQTKVWFFDHSISYGDDHFSPRMNTSLVI